MEEGERQEPRTPNPGPKVPHESQVCLSPDYSRSPSAYRDRVLSPSSLTNALGRENTN